MFYETKPGGGVAIYHEADRAGLLDRRLIRHVDGLGDGAGDSSAETAAELGAFPRYDEKPLKRPLIVDEEEDARERRPI
jgi:hypothetical protein